MINVPEPLRRLLSIPYQARPFALEFLTPSEKQIVTDFGTYLNFVLQHPVRSTPEEDGFIRCIQGLQAPAQEHERVWLKLLHLQSYEALQFLLSQASALSAPLSTATLLEFPECWSRILERFSAGHTASRIELDRLALSSMGGRKLHLFAQTLQVLRGRFEGIQFAEIYFVHSLAAESGDGNSREWIEEQRRLGNATVSYYFAMYCGDVADDIDPKSFSRAHRTGWYYRDTRSDDDNNWD